MCLREALIRVAKFQLAIVYKQIRFMSTTICQDHFGQIVNKSFEETKIHLHRAKCYQLLTSQIILWSIPQGSRPSTALEPLLAMGTGRCSLEGKQIAPRCLPALLRGLWSRRLSRVSHCTTFRVKRAIFEGSKYLPRYPICQIVTT